MSSSTDPFPPGASSEPIIVGYVRRAHGTRGAVLVRPLSDDPNRFSVGRKLLTDDPALGRVEVTSVQSHNEGLLVTLDGVTDRNAAEKLRGMSLLIEAKERRSLAEDEYWPEDLIGLPVFDTTGARVGVVADVIAAPSQDRLRITAAHGEFDVPFVTEIVTGVDIAGAKLTVDLPEGLATLEG